MDTDATKCDVFSFAVLALCVATGAVPHAGLNNVQIFFKVRFFSFACVCCHILCAQHDSMCAVPRADRWAQHSSVRWWERPSRVSRRAQCRWDCRDSDFHNRIMTIRVLHIQGSDSTYDRFVELVREMWSQEPENRPRFSDIEDRLSEIFNI